MMKPASTSARFSITTSNTGKAADLAGVFPAIVVAVSALLPVTNLAQTIDQGIALATCEAWDAGIEKARSPNTLTRQSHAGELAKLAEVAAFLRDDSPYRVPYALQFGPTIAIALDNGWLAGSYFGDPPGELLYIAGSGYARQLLAENIVDIVDANGSYYVISARTEDGHEHGAVHRVEITGYEQFSVSELAVLPSNPGKAWMQSDGSLVVNVGDGQLLMAADGALIPVNCEWR